MLEAHQYIIEGRAVVADDWQVLRLAEGEDAAGVSVPQGKLIVPLAVWQAQRTALAGRDAIGVWLAPDERADSLREDLPRLAVVAVDFPRFTDGRGYSIAYNLRQRLAYRGQLRAIGDVLRDQLFSLARVGFNAFAVRADRDIHDALRGLSVFSETYQGSVDDPLPLFRRRLRGLPPEHTDVAGGI